MIIDPLFFAAIAAFGWGLSLATYRIFALHYDWPMGKWHADIPAVPVLLGLFCLILGFIFAAQRGGELGGWVILLLGLILAMFWTGFMRVASQTSLLLAPVAAGVLLLGWYLAYLR